MGIIDAIADGCFAVARRPVVMLPVVALDLLYWLGGRLTAAPLADAMIALTRTVTDQQPEVASAVLDQVTDAVKPLRGFDLLSILSFGQKPLLPQLPADQVARPWGAGILDPGHWALVVLAMPVLLLASLLWLALTLCLVAQLVRDEPFDIVAVLRQIPRCWTRLTGLVGIVGAGIMLLLLPLVVFIMLLLLLQINPALLTFIPLSIYLLAEVYLSLAPEAIAVSQVGPMVAIKRSIRLVRQNFWSLMGLLVAGLLLYDLGLPIGWGLLARQIAGVPLAIAGNAFIGTGLTAAAMYFYQECLAALDQPVTPPASPPQ